MTDGKEIKGRRVSERGEGVSEHVGSRDMQVKRVRRGGGVSSPMLIEEISHKRYGVMEEIEECGRSVEARVKLGGSKVVGLVSPP